ncbi:exonuclease [Fragilaria crotonensis]|nr:exonuclease [Fragilaria crotonensis]
MHDQPSNRFLVASGQPNGGLQILTPFEDTTENQSNFIFPLVDQGVSITCMTLSEQHVALGTSQGNVLQFELAGYIKHRTQGPINLTVDAAAFPSAREANFTSPSNTPSDIPPEEKIPLVMPSSIAASPSVLICPTVLQSTHLGGMTGFSSFIMCGNPVVSKVGSRAESSFGPMAIKPMIPSPKRTVAETILSAGSRKDGDRGQIIATAAVDVSLHPRTTAMVRKGRKPWALRENPNKFIFSERLSSSCYMPDSRRTGRAGKLSSAVSNALPHVDGVVDNRRRPVVPDRYRLTLRPQRVTTEHFKHSTHNATGMWPGWDYPPSMPNAHVPAVLVLLYFEPEVRTAMLERQFDKRLYTSKTVEQVPILSTELGFLYHYMESISHNAMIHPGDEVDPQIGVFTPVNFLAAFASMPEAANLALLDDNPAVAVTAQRPEAFYRFLLHHLDKEAGSKKSPKKILDSVHGISFISSNEFVSGNGKPTVSQSRALTLDLSYSVPVRSKETKLRFGEILRHSLRRETKLRAWNNTTQSYETVVQRKVATTLPAILSISCACAGRQEGEGLSIWRTCFHDHNLWLPEIVEIELDEGDDVVVRELIDCGELEEKWITFDAKSTMAPKMSTPLVKDRASKNAKQLEHVEELSKLLQQEGGKGNHEFTLTSNLTHDVIASRIERLKHCRKVIPNQPEWVLFNGYVVTPTSVEDARSFHVGFREPCILVYRSIAESARVNPRVNAMHVAPTSQDIMNVIQSKSLSSGHPSKHAIKSISDLPGEGDIVALDAEFVSVQEEKIVIGDTGDKIIFNETRHALARVSVVDCRYNSVLIDDHVLPKEPVVDCLTRFSGIRPGDLDPKTSPHHLVPARTAYLKLRSLLERRCIFLGHGLSTDFLTANLFVPPHQIIDTVELYHKDRHRYISLRFLANYVLGRDTQQEVHDSVEDAMTAYELFQRAKELMANGSFARFLDELYENGQRVNWRLGVDGQPPNSTSRRSIKPL